MVHVPDIQYKSEDEAISLLEENGLTGERHEEYSDNVAAGTVTRQETAAGESVEKGSTVVYYVSLGPEPVRQQAPTRQTQPRTQAPQTAAPQTQPQTPAPTPAPTTAAPTTQAPPPTTENSLERDLNNLRKWQ